MPNKFVAASPASKSNEETVEAWQRWRNEGELLMVKEERRRQAGEQSFERIFANQLLY